MQRAYLSCLYRGLVSIPPLFLKSSVSARFLRNSSPKITKSRVQSPCRFVYFFPLTSRFLESSARNLRRLGCGANVKLLDGLPPRPSQWKFVLENYCLAQGFLWEQNVSQLLILQWQCVQYLRLTLSSSACAPVLIFEQIWVGLFRLLRAEVLSLNPRVDSSRFETRSLTKKFSDCPECQGCPRESSEGEASLMLMRLINWAPL